jgi:hypothetical protein
MDPAIIDDVSHLPIDAVVGQLVELLSTSIVALICAPDTKTVRRWAAGERQPGPDRERTLRFVLQLVNTMRGLEPSSTIGNWLTTYNPMLRDTPSLLLRDFDIDEVSRKIMLSAELHMEKRHAK